MNGPTKKTKTGYEFLNDGKALHVFDKTMMFVDISRILKDHPLVDDLRITGFKALGNDNTAYPLKDVVLKHLSFFGPYRYGITGPFLCNMNAGTLKTLYMYNYYPIDKVYDSPIFKKLQKITYTCNLKIEPLCYSNRFPRLTQFSRVSNIGTVLENMEPELILKNKKKLHSAVIVYLCLFKHCSIVKPIALKIANMVIYARADHEN